jgi:hypothetical protein
MLGLPSSERAERLGGVQTNKCSVRSTDGRFRPTPSETRPHTDSQSSREEAAHPVQTPSYEDPTDRAMAGRYSIDHIAVMATVMPTSRINQKETSGATPISQRTTAIPRSTAASTMFVPLCHRKESVCRAQTAKTMMATAAAASRTLFIAPAGFAKMAL